MLYTKKTPTIKAVIFKNKVESLEELKTICQDLVYTKNKDATSDETVLEILSHEGCVQPKNGDVVYKDEFDRVLVCDKQKFDSMYQATF
jgi:hypothetical protein